MLCHFMKNYDKSEGKLDQLSKDEVTGHLESLEEEVQRYCLELAREEEAQIRNRSTRTSQASCKP